MARGEQLLRHWNLLRTLQTRGIGVTLRELSEQLEVSDRTIQRDLDLLTELNIPLTFEEDDFGKRYWKLPHNYFQSGALQLSLTEAISLHLAAHLLTPLAGTLFAEGLDSVLNKIRSLLPKSALDYFRELDETVFVRRMPTTDYSSHGDTTRTLTAAARTCRSIDLHYRALWRGEEYETRFDPYGLVFYDGDLFTLGHSHRARGIRILKVNRIISATAADATFERPADFSLEDHFRSSFGIIQTSGRPAVEVVVRFTGPVASLVEERLWHETQKLEWLPAEETLFETEPDAAALLATFRLADFVELKRWLKGFGPHAEVLRPAALRDELRSELAAALRLYDA